MTELVEQAMPDSKPRYVYAKLKTLPVNEQDAIAKMILEELEDECLWDEAFARFPGLTSVSCK